MNVEPVAPLLPAAPAPGYRAFISYSRRDGAIAAAFAARLARVGSPWYRVRGMRVFLDKNSLPATPDFEKKLDDSLADSEWLVLLASPHSAASDWVWEELAWWLEHRSTDRLIIACVGGSIAWQGTDGTDFDWRVTTALSPRLSGRLAAQPIWADLTSAARNPWWPGWNKAFRDGVLDVVAPIYGVSKDVLWNKERVEWRTRLAFAAMAAVTMATLFWGLTRTDSVSQDRKENIASIQLGARAFSTLPRDPALAAQVALVGVALRPSGIAASALRSAVARLAGEVPPRFEQVAPGAVALAFSPQATRLAVLAPDGGIALLDAASGRRLGAIAVPAALEARTLVWGASGANGAGVLAAGGRGGARIWPLDEAPADLAAAEAGARSVAIDAGTGVGALALSADGTRLALGLSNGTVQVVAVASGQVVQRFDAGAGAGLRAIAFSNDGKRLATGADDGEAVLWRLADAAPLLRHRMAAAVVSADFNREGSGTLAEHMLVFADAGGALRVVDADAAATASASASAPPAAARLIELQRGGGLAARFVQGRCLVRAGAAGPVVGDATLGFDPLFTFGRAAVGAAPRLAMAVGNVPQRTDPARPGSSLFALLDARGAVAVYEQPLCGDAESVCRFAEPWMTTPMTAAARAAAVPADVDLSQPVYDAPKDACKALIKRVIGAR